MREFSKEDYEQFLALCEFAIEFGAPASVRGNHNPIAGWWSLGWNDCDEFWHISDEELNSIYEEAEIRADFLGGRLVACRGPEWFMNWIVKRNFHREPLAPCLVGRDVPGYTDRYVSGDEFMKITRDMSGG